MDKKREKANRREDGIKICPTGLFNVRGAPLTVKCPRPFWGHSHIWDFRQPFISKMVDRRAKTQHNLSVYRIFLSLSDQCKTEVIRSICHFDNLASCTCDRQAKWTNNWTLWRSESVYGIPLTIKCSASFWCHSVHVWFLTTFATPMVMFFFSNQPFYTCSQ